MPMHVYLDAFSRSLSGGVRAVLVCDRAGWHTSGRLVIPENVTLLHLPPKSPELNPSELLWREMRQKHLGNRVFPDVDSMCDAVSTA
jgi:transposase